MAVTITVTPDSANARMTVAIDMGVGTITAIKVEHKALGGAWEILRAATSLAATAGVVSINDYEVPFDVPIQYRATQVTPAGSATGTSVAITLPSVGYTWLKDPAYPPRNVRLDEITSLDELAFASRAGVFNVIDRLRPVVVAARRADWTGELRLTTSTDQQRDSLNDLLTRGQVLLLSTPEQAGSTFGVGNVYVHVGDVTQARVGLVTEPTRRWVLPLTSVDRPAALATMPVGMRWIDVKNKYATWQALADAGLTWNELLESTP